MNCVNWLFERDTIYSRANVIGDPIVLSDGKFAKYNVCIISKIKSFISIDAILKVIMGYGSQGKLRFDRKTSKVDVDPRSFEFIHDRPTLPRQLNDVKIHNALKN